ncbi:MAG: hypothetical protein JWR43_1848, partial [Phenylobacterium sp.]|nr:hypothetical protein [Phenylobacterium sp.]
MLETYASSSALAQACAEAVASQL